MPWLSVACVWLLLFLAPQKFPAATTTRSPTRLPTTRSPTRLPTTRPSPTTTPSTRTSSKLPSTAPAGFNQSSSLPTTLPFPFPTAGNATLPPSLSPTFESPLDKDKKIVCQLFQIKIEDDESCNGAIQKMFAVSVIGITNERITKIAPLGKAEWPSDIIPDAKQRVIPFNIGSLNALEYLDLRNRKLIGSLPPSFSQLSLLKFLSLDNNPGINGSVVCNQPFRHLSDDSNFGGACFPICQTVLAKRLYDHCLNSIARGLVQYTEDPKQFVPKACANDKCRSAQYADISTLGLGNVTCHECPVKDSRAAPFSTSSSSCIWIVTNIVFALFCLFGSVYIIFNYLLFGRFHFIAFRRTERIVLPLIEEYKITLRSVLALKTNLPILARNKGNLSRWLKRLLFWFLCIVIVPVFSFVAYVILMWRSLIDSIIVLNGLKSSLKKYETYVQILFSLTVNLPDDIELLVQGFLLPFKHILLFLPSIQLDFGVAGVACIGAKSAINLLLQIIIFGITVIISTCDYQIFKVGIYSELIKKFAILISSKTYRKFVKEDDRFNWGMCRYLILVLYTFIATIAGFLFDFPKILQFFLSLISYKHISYFMFHIDSPVKGPFTILVCWAMPFFSVLFYVLFVRDPDNFCDHALKHMPSVDTILLSITFCISVYIIVPLFYELGKVVAPGNRIKEKQDDRVEIAGSMSMGLLGLIGLK